MLKGKIALVTGGARGIGKEIVLRFAENGATVISGDLIDPDYSHENVSHVKLNVTDRENIKEVAAQLKEKYGKLDILVNNAGITRDSLLQRMKEQDWDLVVDINLKGVYNVMQGMVSLLLKSNGASVINMASVVGLDGNAGQTNYSATKGGVIAMAKTWAKEFGRKNLRSNAIAPGFIKTDMTHELPEKVVESVLENTPLRKMGEASDVADAALFLASDLSGFITGQVIRVDGGLNL
ncbi:3-oxoacyl-ACP reductase FabG [Pseudoleptotrichia goodfellowii]|uniref:Oxidoreductase, short chain dehydrogenase/reductase family protein n=1 Tax=Pseudoleptotrichia goodfellowii F0264 TaxID=596323 RepID=D0GMT3_9FUSO|nr:3-oxoacyl-ACP reductase FabG [Pseudoleptotrichia goodfellowii]EEY34612.1 oxidoreductase, short chain dehydrogenase/reductase family protein [Pseudoleptotrichia goodfellowii F0264]MBF4805420.1 3-oxoacyl-ACP reductase FabG [Pseudoleptotrichia goodfellowii]